MKYYEPEHTDAYARLRAEGKSAWDQLHGRERFEDSQIRGMLASALRFVRVAAPLPSALEYGCGTGPGACLLAERGMRVRGVDLSPVAIEIARREAAKRNLAIDYQVGDVCQMPPPGERVDLVVDSFCLQGIVTDADRAKLVAFVRAALKPDGYYVVATAGFSIHRDYGDCLYDRATGIVLEPCPQRPGDVEDAQEIGGRWYVPCRRHVTLFELELELRAAGFDLEWGGQDANGDITLVARPRATATAAATAAAP